MRGASWSRTFRRITLPLLKPGLAAGWALLFVAFIRTLSALTMLQVVIAMLVLAGVDGGEEAGVSR
jgi:ABC-type Fe3+ transport system permease subunit